MMQEIKRTKVKTYSWIDRTGDMFTVHFNKSVTGLRIVVTTYEDGETEIKFCKGDGTKGTFKEFSKVSLNNATTEQIEAVITEMKKENLKK